MTAKLTWDDGSEAVYQMPCSVGSGFLAERWVVRAEQEDPVFGIELVFAEDFVTGPGSFDVAKAGPRFQLAIRRSSEEGPLSASLTEGTVVFDELGYDESSVFRGHLETVLVAVGDNEAQRQAEVAADFRCGLPVEAPEATDAPTQAERFAAR